MSMMEKRRRSRKRRRRRKRRAEECRAGLNMQIRRTVFRDEG